MKVHEQTPDEARKWKAATTGVWKSVEDQFGPELSTSSGPMRSELTTGREGSR